MVISVAQSAMANDPSTGNSGNTISVNISGIQAGSTLYALYASDNNNSVPNTVVSDSVNGTWPTAIGYARMNGFQTLGHSYFPNSAASAGSMTITATFNASYTKKAITIIEIRGAITNNPLTGNIENVLVAPGNSANAITSGLFVSRNAPCLIIGGNYAATQNASSAYSGTFSSIASDVWTFGIAGFASFGYRRLTSISSSALTTTVSSADALGLGTYYAVAAKFTENFTDGALLGVNMVGFSAN